jgi:hypothetical protein
MPNTNRIIATMDCPRCGRPNSKIRNNFSFCEHGNPICLGPDPEIVLSILLRLAGLDARPDRHSEYLGEDPAWTRWQKLRNGTHSDNEVNQCQRTS